MPKTQNRQVMFWLFAFVFVVAFLVVFGGFVRLTHSGLSVVEWNPVSGVIPPVGEKGWEIEFEKYQQTPEFLKVNFNITLEEYKRIFLIEWVHRLIARLAGLFYAVPAIYFLLRRIIPWKEFGVYFLMGFLFIFQAVMGWAMVASGLVDRPSVSHILLTVHLLFALSLFGLSLWMALGHRFGFPKYSLKAKWSPLTKLAVMGLFVLIIQISYGGFNAGLKSGYLSNTWPLMFGKWILANLFDRISNLIEAPTTILFIHRWFAFFALIFGLGLYFSARRRNYPREIINALLWVLGVGVFQITLGVLVTIFHVQMSLALFHQGSAVFLFGLAINFLFQLRALDYNNSLDERT